MSLLISLINNRISSYSFHSESSSKVDLESESSLLFKKWMRTIDQSNVLRLYTLNYDRLFKVLINNVGIDCFYGFDLNDNNFDFKGVRANVPRILNDFNCNCHSITFMGQHFGK